MKYIQLCLILLTAALTGLKGQVYSKEYGKIGREELDLITYSPDNSAEAVVLYDIGKSYFVDSENSFDVIYERATRIKILTDAGLKWAEIDIPYYQEGGIYEKIEEVVASTYNTVNGQLVETPFNVSEGRDEKINEFWYVKKIALPNVKKGSIIEYKYKISSQYKFNLRDWEFQWKIPVVYSEYIVKMIPFYEYSWLLQGASRFALQKSWEDKGVDRRFGAIQYKDMVHQYVMKNLPAFNDEEYITSINDYIIKLDFQLSKVIQPSGSAINVVTTWPDLIKDLLKNEDFGRYAAKSENLAAKLFPKDQLEGKTASEKFEMVMNFVKGNIIWNKFNGRYASKSPSAVLKDKFGNAADINLLAVGLLNGVGVEAFPVLISTREHGKIKDIYPFIQFFDYVLIIASVEGKYVLCDATDVLCSNYRIPARCINDRGLMIKKEGVDWVNLQASRPTELQERIVISSVENIQQAEVSLSAVEYDAYYLRSTYGENKKKIIEKISGDGIQVIDTSIVVRNQDRIKEPYYLKFKISFPAERINGKFYISPFLNETISDNPLKQSTRAYPIDMIYPSKRSYISTITIPEGYKVDFIPSDFNIRNESFELNYAVVHDEKIVNVTFDYYFRKPVYLQYDYQEIKSYFNEIIKRGHDKIVLSPK